MHRLKMPGPRSCSVTVQQYRAACRGLRSAHHRQTFDYLGYSREDMEIALVIPRYLYSMFATITLEAISICFLCILERTRVKVTLK